MAITLPLPLRVAAGILATGIDRVRALPEDIPALPVSLIGNAMRLSMKVQQEIAALATRGDELLGGVIGAPQENPSWARFDDDEPASPPARPRTWPNGRGTTASGPDRAADRTPATTSDGRTDGGHHLTTPETTSLAPETTIAMAAALEVPAAVVEQALVAADDADRMVDEQHADAVSDDIVEAVAGGADADALADVSDRVAELAVDEAAADLQEALVEGAVLEEALIEETVLEEAALEEAAETALEETLLEEAVEEAVEEAAVQAELEAAAEAAVEEALEAAAEQEVLVETLDEVAAEETVLEGALVEAAVEQAVLEEQLEQVVREHAEQEAALEAAIAETVQAEEVLEEALEETLEEEADIAAALDDTLDGSPSLAGPDDDTDLPLTGYNRLTLAQVRGHLRDLSADEVAVLLQYERDTENRPPFLTLLSNRLVTLDAQNS